MHIALAGYYGFGNAGDDAILVAVVDAVRRTLPATAITVITYPGGDLDAVRPAAGVEAVDGADLGGVDAALALAEVLIVGGGGLIQDYLPSDDRARLSPHQANLGFWTTLAVLARARATRTMTWAIGIGPLTTAAGRHEAALFLSLVDRVTVRDEESARLARELGARRITVAGDPAFLLEPAPGDPVAAEAEVEDLPVSGSRRVAVVVRSWGDDRWMDPLAAGLDRLVEELDADVIFVPFQQGGRGLANDALASTRVAARMRHRSRRAVLGVPLTPAQKHAALAHSDLVVGMRLHAVVFAATAGVPVVALAYDPKVRLAMESLGAADQCLDLDGIDEAELVTRASAARPADAAAVADLRRRAESVGAELTELLAEPPPRVDPALAVAATAAVLRADEGADAAADRDAAIAARNEVTLDRDNYREAYDKLAAEYQAVLDSRAVKAVRSLWTARDRAKDLPGLLRTAAVGIARRILPPPLKRALRNRLGAPVTRRAELAPEDLAAAEKTITADLDRFVATHADGPGFVILPPGIGWDVELFQRPQQVALAFARLGYGVLYHLEEKYADGLVGYRDRGDGILVGHVPDQLVDLLHRVPRPIYLSYVYNFEWRDHLDRPVTVYEHIDDLEVFEHVYRRQDLDRWHEVALAQADVVAASAMDLLEHVRPVRPDAILVGNGVDYDHFATPRPRPDDLAGIPDPIVGYYGALAEWFDYDLLAGAAARLPEHHFVLIGPDYDGTAPSHAALALPNVHWLGPRPYADLPAYLGAFAVATIPFVVNEVTHAVSPLKLFEYMAGGKPVVTPPLRECTRYRAVQVGEGVDGFVEQIRLAVDLGADPDHAELLRRTARANTWEARARAIVEAVEAL